jgi:hypothetical protein
MFFPAATGAFLLFMPVASMPPVPSDTIKTNAAVLCAVLNLQLNLPVNKKCNVGQNSVELWSAPLTVDRLQVGN